MSALMQSVFFHRCCSIGVYLEVAVRLNAVDFGSVNLEVPALMLLTLDLSVLDQPLIWVLSASGLLASDRPICAYNTLFLVDGCYLQQNRHLACWRSCYWPILFEVVNVGAVRAAGICTVELPVLDFSVLQPRVLSRLELGSLQLAGRLFMSLFFLPFRL